MKTINWFRKYWENNKLPILFVFPAILCLFVITLYPTIRGIWLGYNKINFFVSEQPYFVGLQNFMELMKDRTFWLSLKQTFLFGIGSVAGQFLVGFILALCLNEKFKGRSIFRVIMIIPWAIPIVVAALQARWMFNSHYGVINDLLLRFGLISERLNFLGVGSLALPTVTFTNIWKGYPFFMLVILAALQSIPPQLYEAAKVDGARFWERFIYITVPSIRSALAVCFLLGFVWAINNVTIIYTMTKGGPAGRTMTVASYTFIQAFSQFKLGYGAAISNLVFLYTLIFSIIYVKVTMKQD